MTRRNLRLAEPSNTESQISSTMTTEAAMEKHEEIQAVVETGPAIDAETNVMCVPSDVNIMASTKQCISCNREMPHSSETCICGHVLSDIKSLEGKRYSGYREELYSRLEIRRILQDYNDKPKRPRLKQKSPPKQEISGEFHKQIKRKRNRRKPSQMPHFKREPEYQKNNATSKHINFEDNPDLWYLNPRFNFTDALAEINKRLTSQTSFWISL